MRLLIRSGLIFFIFLHAEVLSAQVLKNKISPQKNKSIKFVIHFNETKGQDSLYLIRHHCFSNNYLQDSTMGSAKDAKSNYYFEIEDAGSLPIYVSFYREYTAIGTPAYILNLYLAELGDSVVININKDNESKETAKLSNTVERLSAFDINFFGKGSNKYRFRYELDKLIEKNIHSPAVLNSKFELTSKSFYDKELLLSNQLLQKYIHCISRNAYEILKVDCFARLELGRLQDISIAAFPPTNYKTLFDKVMASYENRIHREQLSFTNYAKTLSGKYPQFIVKKSLIGKSLISADKMDVWNPYLVLKRKYSGELKDRILSCFAIQVANSKYGQDILTDALASIKTAYCLEELHSFDENNSIGKAAYNFSLPDTNGHIVKLEDFRGKVVFVDFWFKGCGACMGYYRNILTKVEDKFSNDPNVVFITINANLRKQDWIESLNSGLYTSTHCVNLYTEGKGVNHPVIQKFKVDGYPRPILIDKKGNIYYNDSEKLLESVETLTNIISNATIH